MALRFKQRINGFVYGYSDIDIDINGVKFDEVESIDYDYTIERGELRGTSPVPQGYTVGSATYKGSMTLSKDQANLFRKILGTAGFATRSFQITITYGPTKESDSGSKTCTDVLYGCLLVGGSNSHSRSGNALMEKMDFVIQDMSLDGIKPYGYGGAGTF